MGRKESLTPQGTKDMHSISVRLKLLDSSVPQDEIVATFKEPISAGIEANVTIGTETRKVRIQRILIDPSRNPRIEVLGRNANIHISFPILSSVRRLFYLFRLLSIGHWIRQWGMGKGRRTAVSGVDWYIIFWVVVEFLMIGLLAWGTMPTVVHLSFAIVACYRIFELIQVYFNILLFDPLQHYEAGEEYFLYSSARSVLIAIISYGELIACYALLYNANIPNGFSPNAPISNILGALYFSTITLATVGYGDIVPIHGMRLASMTEAFFGVLYTATIIARFLNFLPSPKGDSWWR